MAGVVVVVVVAALGRRRGNVQGCSAGGVHDGDSTGVVGWRSWRRVQVRWVALLFSLQLLLSQDGGEDDFGQLWCASQDKKENILG